MAYQTEKALSRASALRQLPIGPHFVDFACRSAKLIVEIDGATHRHAREVDNDEIRTKFFGGTGLGSLPRLE